MISVFLALVILGTSWDVLVASKHKQKDSSTSSGSPSIIVKLLLCFSVYSNGKKILSTTKLKGSIDCIHGIRFFSMCWVVMGHTWYVNLKAPPDNIFDLGDVSFNRFNSKLPNIQFFKNDELIKLFSIHFDLFAFL